VSTGLLKSSLASGLRLAAKEAVEEIGDGVAFVFATAGDSILDVRLRAASGFDSAEEAQTAASRLLPRVREVLSDDGATPGPLPAHEALGRSGAGGLCIHPLRENGHLHGALVVGSPTPLSPERCSGLGRLAAELTLRFDHARLLAECARLRQQLASRGTLEDEKSEEVLKLSEALFAQDIELLRNNEKLGKIERLKNDFIEKMSRELRTPLNSIIEAIISVLTGEDDKLSDDAKSVLRSALDDGTSFLRTLQNILDLWKIKQAELPVEIQDVNFCELVDEAIFSVQDTIGEKPLVVTPKLEATFPRFRTDLAKVNQILFLLLDNAAKFTPHGEITIDARIDEGMLHASVRDSGVGICRDDQQFVFDEFFQVDEPSSQRYRGAGLGLTLVRDLVTLLDGDVWIESDVGRGTTVGFTIPVQPA
jgi:signal transduction histidine kinase